QESARSYADFHGAFLPLPRASVGRLTRDGQREPEGCSHLGVVLRPDSSPMRLNEGSGEGQPQPHAMLLRRKERLETTGASILRDASPHVADRNFHAATLIQDRAHSEPFLSGHVRHCFHAVKEEVQYYLLQMDLVPLNEG